jgi:hypothetical protein
LSPVASLHAHRICLPLHPATHLSLVSRAGQRPRRTRPCQVSRLPRPPRIAR